MKYFVKTDENNKLLMLMRDKHPLINECVVIDLTEDEYAEISANINRYSLVINEGNRSLVYTETTEDEILAAQEEQNHAVLNSLRKKRNTECFSVVNRGSFWYETLDDMRKDELKNWYQAWLDVTETRMIPEKPEWLK